MVKERRSNSKYKSPLSLCTDLLRKGESVGRNQDFRAVERGSADGGARRCCSTTARSALHRLAVAVVSSKSNLGHERGGDDSGSLVIHGERREVRGRESRSFIVFFNVFYDAFYSTFTTSIVLLA